MKNVVFGLDVPTSLETIADPVVAALAAESLGFDFVSANDHVLGPSPRYEGWTLLSWLAASTSRIRIASRVLGVPYREPTLVAKMAETLDRLSDGRLILGLGAGSGEGEFAAMGITVGTVGDRVGALEEAIHIIRGLWSEPTLTFQGRRYESIDAQIEPKPAHRIPIWLGTVGGRGLDLVGRVGDGWIPSFMYAPPDRAPAMIQRILAAAAKANRDPDQIDRIYNVEVSVGKSEQADVITGTPDAIAEKLLGFLGIGFTGFNLLPVGKNRDAQIEQLAAEVIPAVRAGI